MTDDQTRTIMLLRNELRKKRRILEELPIDEYRGDVFTEVNGDTVKIGRAGGIDPLLFVAISNPSVPRLTQIYTSRNSENEMTPTQKPLRSRRVTSTPGLIPEQTAVQEN